ncbi:MAG TPA: hypothetical protein VHA52_04455, partial [Candidatus Babeliaceae bacterium]|nr:hypothetical protein [Candidatus Babeliaceae bacterium]
MAILKQSRWQAVLIFIVSFIFYSAYSFAQKATSCDVLVAKNRDLFIDSYYFSGVFYKDFSTESIDHFFAKSWNVEDLDSLLELKAVNGSEFCSSLTQKRRQLLYKFFAKDYELDMYLRKKQVQMEDILECLYLNRSYRKLVTKHFTNSKQSIYSLSETQGQIILYNLVCYLTLKNIEV